MAIANVDDKLRLTKVEIFYDPMAMFRQMNPEEELKKQESDVELNEI